MILFDHVFNENVAQNIMQANIFDQLPGNIGWKASDGKHLGCNTNLAKALQFKNPEKIVGLTDHDLPDQTDESCHFHHKNDRLVLSGQSVSGIHQSLPPYDGSLFYFIKKPLFANNKMMGIIYYCQPFMQSKSIDNLIINDRKYLPAKSYYTFGTNDNPYKLSTRELECLFLMLRSKTAKQIGEILHLSKRTIEFYIVNIKNKLGSQSKSDLLCIAIQHGYMN